MNMYVHFENNNLISHSVYVLFQVELMALSTIVAVQTRGSMWFSFWTKQYRLTLSQDCVNFSPLLDEFGSNVVK